MFQALADFAENLGGFAVGFLSTTRRVRLALGALAFFIIAVPLALALVAGLLYLLALAFGVKLAAG
jgi:hypothetical protein